MYFHLLLTKITKPASANAVRLKQVKSLATPTSMEDEDQSIAKSTLAAMPVEMGGDENSGGDLTALILDKICFSVKKRAEPPRKAP